MNAARWKLLIYLAAIFAAGTVSGWMVAVKTNKERPMRPPPDHRRLADKYMHALRSELNLTTDQQQKVGSIMDQFSEQMKSLHGQHVKRIGEVVSNRNDQIMAVLDPEQKKLFQENEARRFEKFRSRRGSRDRDESGRKDEKCETNNSTESHREKGKP